MKRVIVKCSRCSSEFEMPDIGVPVTMDHCPTCQSIEEVLKNLGYTPQALSQS